MHGGPPSNKSGRCPFRRPAAFKMSLVGVSRMSFWMTGDASESKFFSIVSAASLSRSTAARTLNPACSAPRSSPPAPEKGRSRRHSCLPCAQLPTSHPQVGVLPGHVSFLTRFDVVLTPPGPLRIRPVRSTQSAENTRNRDEPSLRSQAEGTAIGTRVGCRPRLR